MTAADELLTMRVGGVRARSLEHIVALALSEVTSGHANPDAPSRADIESELREQIGHGKRLLEMAEPACRDLAAYVKLQPAVHKVLTEALAEAVRHFRNSQKMAADWTRRQGEPLDGAPDLGPLIAGLDDRRAELIAAWHDVFPGLELERVSQAIRDLDAGKGRPLDDVLAELAR